jgi:hypothetical protein
MVYRVRPRRAPRRPTVTVRREYRHFYVEQNSDFRHSSDTAWTTVTGTTINGTDLLPNRKYLIIARAFLGQNNPDSYAQMRVQTDDDSTIETKSAVLYEMQQTGSLSLGKPFWFVHSYTTDTAPADIRFQVKRDANEVFGDQLSLFLLDLDDVGAEGSEYHEDIQAAAGSEYSTTADTTVLASLAAADLGTTEEWLILGYAMTGIGNVARWYDVSADGADDAASASTLNRQREQGEDTAEVRINGILARHKAVTSDVAFTVYGQEENADANMTDQGAYLIALKASLFADLEHDFTPGEISYSSETTVATVGPYTPSTGGNHLILGRAGQGSTTLEYTMLWLEDGTTETRSGDNGPVSQQKWHWAYSFEPCFTFQRINFATEKTYNLQSDVRNATTGNQANRYLFVLNLVKAAAAAPVTEQRTFTGSVTPSGDVDPYSAKTTVSGAVTPSGDVDPFTAKTSVAGAVTPSGDPAILAGISPDGAVTPTGALTVTKRIALAVAGVISTITGALIRKAGISPAGSVTPSGDVDPFTVKTTPSGSVAPSGDVDPFTAKTSVAGAVTPTGDPAILAGISADGSITPTGDPAILVGLVPSGDVTPTGDPAILVGISPDGSVTPTGSLTASKKIFLAVSGVISTITGALTRRAQITPDGSVTPTGAVGPVTAKTGLTGALTPAGDPAILVGISPDGSVTPTGSLTASKKIILAVAGVVSTITGALTRRAQISPDGEVTPTGDAALLVGISPDGSVTPTGSLTASKKIILAVAGTVGSAGALVRKVSTTLSSTVPSSGALVRKVSTIFTGAVTSIIGTLNAVKVAAPSARRFETSSSTAATETSSSTSATETSASKATDETGEVL